MEESTTKGLESLELNDRDAAIRETRSFSDISVEGFETCSFQKYALKLALTKHFASCRKVLSVSVFKSVALMRIEGEDAEEKALKLSGIDVGGWTGIVKPAQWQSVPYDPMGARMKEWRMFVKGYDTRLPDIDIRIALCKHLSSCGEVTHVYVHRSKALIIIRGEGCVEKVMKQSEKVGGMNLVVDPHVLRSEKKGLLQTYWLYAPISFT